MREEHSRTITFWVKVPRDEVLSNISAVGWVQQANKPLGQVKINECEADGPLGRIRYYKLR